MANGRRYRTALLGAAALGATAFAYGYCESRQVEVVELELELPRLAPAFDGYRLVQISDSHVGPWLSCETLRGICERVSALKPDLIAFTGDVVTATCRRISDELTAVLHTLRAWDGVVAILGNHDYDAGAERVRGVLRDAGIRVLYNAVHTLRRGEDSLHLAGVDDVIEGQPRLDLVLEQLPEDGAAILLAHEPGYADRAAETGRFDLQLSGHSHGGQVRLPGIGTLYLPLQVKDYVMGQYRAGQMILYVNRGLGTVHLPVRFLCPPEITVLTLRSPRG
ncbi:MAG: metallophosphoesterase [Armatimonadetes bacterium]|nr:metallophosphoesterase [Armatimonadota bacterium]